MESLVEKFEKTLLSSDSLTHGLKKDIIMEHLNDAFEELFPILRLLGTAFYFVEKDISGKLKIIRENQEKNKDISTIYLLEYMYFEYDDGNNKKISSKQGTARNALRLSRALHFIELFLSRLNSVDQDLKSAAQISYADSLSNFHTWTVRKAVGLAFYTLPSRERFLKDLNLDAEAPDVFESLVQVTKSVREVMDEFYKTFDLQSI